MLGLLQPLHSCNPSSYTFIGGVEVRQGVRGEVRGRVRQIQMGFGSWRRSQLGVIGLERGVRKLYYLNDGF